LSFDDARTLFHEFATAAWPLSNVTFERLSGTNVLRDSSAALADLRELAVRARKVRRSMRGTIRRTSPFPTNS